MGRKTEQPYRRAGFFAFVATLTQGAFSDNLYRMMVLLYVPVLLTPENGEAARTANTPLAFALFNLPWLLIPAMAGALADRFSKKRVTVWTKLFEVCVMSVGGVGLVMGSPWLLFTMLFMMALQSAVFSPAKYGILPEILPESRLSWGNGVMQMGTFLAIILGTAAAGFLLDQFAGRLEMAAVTLVGFSVIGLVASLLVTPSKPARPEAAIPWNPYHGMGRYFRVFFRDRWLLMAMVCIAFFWFAGSVVMQNVVELGKTMVDGKAVTLLGVVMDSGIAQSLLLTSIALGIGLGSFAAGYLSRGKIEVGLAPLGLLGMVVFGLLLALPDLSYGQTLVLLVLLGASGGLFDIPFAATLQERSPDKIKGGMIATSNFVTFAGMFGAAGLFYLFYNQLHFSNQAVFLAISLLAMAAGSYICLSEPVVLLRAVLWLCNGTLFRMTVTGRRHVPDKGGVLFVSTHISIIDALVLTAATDREVRFVMGKNVMDVRWSRRIAKMMNVILFDPDDPGACFAAIREALDQGRVVCVNRERFSAEGGPEYPWFADYHQLVKDTDAPVVPIHMSRLWHGLYYFNEGKLVWRLGERWRYPVLVTIGEAVPADVAAHEVRSRIEALGLTAYMERKHRYDLLHHAFAAMARRHPGRMAVADGITGSLSFFKTFVGSLVFARKLRKLLDDRDMVGVLVPPSVGGVLTNVALMFLGRTPINLNYSVSSSVVASCAGQCGITQVITSRRFLEKVPIDVPGETIFLEDVKESVTGKDRIVAMLVALVLPVRLIEKMLGATRRTEEDLATIIFSSGSEGEPKGVMLTHRNVIGNIEGTFEVFPHHSRSAIIGFLPVFHSFGFMAALWLPLTQGIAGIYHANPLEAKVIGGLIQKYKGTIMLGSSTFLQGFIRRCTPEQLASLEFIVCGAEKLAPRVRIAFFEKFGCEPLEAYGTTECTPAVSLNIPDCVSPGFFFHGTTHGTIGRVVTGVSVRVSDPYTGALLPLGEAGLLHVKGVNIMRGYLDQPEKTARVLKDGWYNTGDIAKLDEEGFIRITDRLSRFSKIGGEMVPHNRIEETLHEVLGLTDQSLAVAGVPDKAKGERLVVLHILDDHQLKTLLDKLPGCDLPNLWRPRPSAFHRIKAIPVLATGKMDIKTVRTVALELGGDA